MTELRALVVDDEPLARRRLRRLLEMATGVTWAGEASSGREALDAIRRVRPDLVFLDIRMPGLTGLQVLERADPPVQVVFTTAFDEHAVAAFELRAADYLLKPFGPERLQAAVERVRELVAARRRPSRRLLVRERGRVVPVSTSSIVRLEAEGDYVRVHAGGREHLLTGSLGALHGRLDPERFVRVHRSHVVNLDFVDSIEPWEGSRLRIALADGSHVVASRSRARALRARFG